jgi:hypothetical protein
LIPGDDDGIVVVMSEAIQRTMTKEEFNRELVRTLDDPITALLRPSDLTGLINRSHR